MEKIMSKDNRLVKEFVRLAASKGARDESGLFALEGVKLVQEALSSGLSLRCLLLTEGCLQKHGDKFAGQTGASSCFLISDAVESKLSLQKSPQGVYAVAEKLDKTLSLATIGDSGRYVMLCDLQDAGNVGTILRTAEALGIDGVILTKHTCDLYSPKVLRGSMGAAFRVPTLVIQEPFEFIAALREKGVSTYASVADPSAAALEQLLFDQPAVLLIGNEGSGLDERIVFACTRRVTIRMAGRTESLNAAIAACILLWEMSK